MTVKCRLPYIFTNKYRKTAPARGEPETFDVTHSAVYEFEMPSTRMSETTKVASWTEDHRRLAGPMVEWTMRGHGGRFYVPAARAASTRTERPDPVCRHHVMGEWKAAAPQLMELINLGVGNRLALSQALEGDLRLASAAASCRGLEPISTTESSRRPYIATAAAQLIDIDGVIWQYKTKPGLKLSPQADRHGDIRWKLEVDHHGFHAPKAGYPQEAVYLPMNETAEARRIARTNDLGDLEVLVTDVHLPDPSLLWFDAHDRAVLSFAMQALADGKEGLAVREAQGIETYLDLRDAVGAAEAGDFDVARCRRLIADIVPFLHFAVDRNNCLAGLDFLDRAYPKAKAVASPTTPGLH